VNGTPGPGDRRNGLVNVCHPVKGSEHEQEAKFSSHCPALLMRRPSLRSMV